MDNFLIIIYGWIGLAIMLFPIQLITTAPYGRHVHSGWGITIGNKLGWFVMEIVSPSIFAYFFLFGTNIPSLPMWIFFALWIAHYANRSIIYPLRINTSGKRIPILIVISAIFFNVVNGWLNGYMLGTFYETYPSTWLYSPQMIVGILVFGTGMFINISSDNHLISLRSKDGLGYKIPKGGLFEKISCPNHFGEILEWVGFAIMCWNPAAFSFAVWTTCNLVPRAISHHKWYLKKFEKYPSDRKAIIPYIL